VRRALATGLGLVAFALPASAGAVEYAPVNHPGPPLGVPQAQLDGALVCKASVQNATVAPVLLIHGTGSDPVNNFSWNWQPALDAIGVPWCTVALPGNGMDDVQVAGEYVVHAIRSMHQQAGRRISIVGHSQGGMIGRWALRFWPDTRPMVDDLIGLAPSNHGTASAQFTCIPDCAPATWQQAAGSEFVKALNSGQETFAGISYTSVYTHTDPIVTPNFDDTGSSSLHGGDGEITNVAIQDVCPLNVSEHLMIGTVDNTAYVLAIDALTNAGPADPSRLAAGVCSEPFHPGVNELTALGDVAAAAASLALAMATYPHVPAEPPLAPYVTATSAGGPGGDDAAGKPKAVKCKKKAKKKKRVHKRRAARCLVATARG
jgi:triacylglycerol esterase/lipase EstA (alpha/beta hydrolase family)